MPLLSTWDFDVMSKSYCQCQNVTKPLIIFKQNYFTLCATDICEKPGGFVSL